MAASASSPTLPAESKLLCDLVKSKDEQLLSAFLQRDDLGTIVNVKSDDGDWPLLVAAKRGNARVTTALLKAGANPDTSFDTPGTFAGYRAIHFAAGNDDVATLDALLGAHACVNSRSEEDWTPLHVAAYKGKHRALEWLIKHGADVNAATKQAGQTPLLFSVSYGRPVDVRLLLQNGAKTALLADDEGNTALHHACGYPMSKMLDGAYDIPDVQLDVLVALLLRGDTGPTEPNAEGRLATFYWVDKMPALQSFCELLYRCQGALVKAKYEWNYMSLVTAKASAFTAVGISAADADSLFQVARAVDEERLLASMRAPRPTANAAPSVAALASIDTSVDPSGGKCPFFQRKPDEKDATAAAPPAASSYQFDPSGGKCPFFKGLPVDPHGTAASPVCPFSFAYLRRHQSQLVTMTVCFLLGAAVDRLVLRLQRAS